MTAPTQRTTEKANGVNGYQPDDDMLLDVGRLAEIQPTLDVTNTAEMIDWLRDNMGTGPLAGMFARGDSIVHTPCEGEAGYVAFDQGEEDEQLATVRPINTDYLAAQVQVRYRCVKVRKKRNGEVITDTSGQPSTTKALFPTAAARVASNAGPESFPKLRKLRGVIHAPVFRMDGTIVDRPGYDPDTKLLYVPEPGLNVPAVSAEPTEAEVKAARDMVLWLVSGFPFLNLNHRANWLGSLITPLLRNITPPPWKLLSIEAHQPGSGKTKLAKLIQTVHGGEFSSDMPPDDTELGKQITSILTNTTGSTVVWDNVSGAFKSPKLAGLLTSKVWGDRPLGVSQRVTRPNDRLWIISGNNVQIGGDLPRRTLRAVIDPGIPNPERRAFDFEPVGWASRNKGKLLHALLTLVRHWAVQGMPVPDMSSSDDYGEWIAVVQGILDAAGIEGTFDHANTRVELGDDDENWGIFLRAIFDSFGAEPWTAAEMLARVGGIADNSIPVEALPSTSMSKEAARGEAVALAKSMGKWLKINTGRITGGYCVRVNQPKDKTRKGITLWRIHKIGDDQ